MTAPKVGLLVPMWAEGNRGPDWATLKRHAQASQDAGFDSLWVCDDAMYRLDGEQLPIFGCIPIAAALCAVTSQIEIGTLVTNAHSRSPAQLAKDADTLAAMSAGRFILGLGAGDDQSQHEALGLPWEGRFRAYEEALEIITTLLRSGSVSFEGQYYRAVGAELVPHTQPPPKILVGGKGPHMLRRAAKYADIWNAYIAWSGGDAGELLSRFRDACDRAGRDPSTIEASVAIAVAFDDAPVRVGNKVFPDVGVRGDASQVADELWRLGELGFAHVQVQTAPFDLSGLDRMAEAVDLLRAR
jgi:alkanesulfonate monooxygenase SsuD/methylene tetrahydromethanopterin reductase-like flavin-dependent oxidoreductase (luciferase family)